MVTLDNMMEPFGNEKSLQLAIDGKNYQGLEEMQANFILPKLAFWQLCPRFNFLFKLVGFWNKFWVEIQRYFAIKKSNKNNNGGIQENKKYMMKLNLLPKLMV